VGGAKRSWCRSSASRRSSFSPERSTDAVTTLFASLMVEELMGTPSYGWFGRWLVSAGEDDARAYRSEPWRRSAEVSRALLATRLGVEVDMLGS
jgi:hypothetical protein